MGFQYSEPCAPVVDICAIIGEMPQFANTSRIVEAVARLDSHRRAGVCFLLDERRSLNSHSETIICRRKAGRQEIQRESSRKVCMSNQPELINPPEAGPHSGYTHGVKVQSNNLLFVAGQIGRDETGTFVGPDLVSQYDKSLSNLLAVVRQAGGSPVNVVQLTIYVLDKQEFIAAQKPLGEVYRRRMGKHFPAITLVEVKSLYEDAAKVEIEAIAAL